MALIHEKEVQAVRILEIVHILLLEVINDEKNINFSYILSRSRAHNGY